MSAHLQYTICMKPSKGHGDSSDTVRWSPLNRAWVALVHGLQANLPHAPKESAAHACHGHSVALLHCKTTSLVTRPVTNQWLVSTSLA